MAMPSHISIGIPRNDGKYLEYHRLKLRNAYRRLRLGPEKLRNSPLNMYMNIVIIKRGFWVASSTSRCLNSISSLLPEILDVLELPGIEPVSVAKFY